MIMTIHPRYLLSTLALLLWASMISAHEQSSDNYTMPKDVLSNGGDKSNSSNYQMVATVGQYATEKGTANGKVLYSGFYAPRSTRSPKSNSACGGITEGLVACYPFDGNANDASGNGNHGIVKGATLTEDRFGNADSAYTFNGINNYIHLSSLDSIGFNNGTVTLWFKLATGFHTGNKNINLFSKDNQSYEQNVIEAFFDDNTGKIKLDYGDFGQSIFSDSDSWDYQWYHLAFTWGSIGLKMYVNGIRQADTSDIVSPVNADTITHIGTHQATASFFKGEIDDILIYNRALSDTEIKQLYNGTEEPCEPEVSVQPLYRVLQWWQVQTPFELQDKTACGDMNWTSKANQPWLSVSPTSGTDDATLKAMMYPSFWFNVGSFTTTAPDAIGSPANNLVIQPGLWWWWRYWVMQLFSGTIHPNQVIPHIIGINQMMWGPMIFKVTWPGSDLDLKITTPSGKVLTKDSPEVLQVHQGDTEEYWVVQSQEQGDWQVEVVAIEVDAEGEAYQLEIIANERTAPPTEDTDGDGLPDEWETYFLGDLSQEGSDDSDNDGVSNLQEFQQQLNPVSEDTDGDGELDSEEIAIAPATCQLYAVHDKGVNDAQFFTVNLDNFMVTPLGPLYKNHDIEALAVHPETDMLYAAAGDKATDGKPGDFYRVDGQTGELFSIGGTGFTDIEDLAFSPDGTLYAWAKGDGLITIDLTTGQGTLVLASQETQIEGLTLKKEAGLIFLGAVGTDLWQYNSETKMLEILCPNQLLGETEALEITPEGLLLIGTHNVPFGLHAFEIETCKPIEADETLSNQFDDVEGIALPIAACAK
jgi:hypothetical protein